jgi:hypothetical protein
VLTLIVACSTICLAIMSSLPIAMIVVGAQHRHDCRRQPRIPEWLMVMGASVLFRTVIIYLYYPKQRWTYEYIFRFICIDVYEWVGMADGQSQSRFPVCSNRWGGAVAWNANDIQYSLVRLSEHLVDCRQRVGVRRGHDQVWWQEECRILWSNYIPTGLLDNTRYAYYDRHSFICSITLAYLSLLDMTPTTSISPPVFN